MQHNDFFDPNELQEELEKNRMCKKKKFKQKKTKNKKQKKEEEGVI
jgi:hypothetical protein